MTNAKPYLFAAIVLLMVIFALLVRGCKPGVVNPDTPTPSEQKLQRVVSGRDKKNEQLAADTLKYLAQLEAHSREINYWRSKYTAETRKGAGIEQRYREKPTLETCDTLLQNKEERIAALRGNLEAARKDSLNKATMLKTYAEHVFDKDMRIDSLAAGWQEANTALRKEKGKRFAISAGVGYGITPSGLQPTASVQVAWIIKRF